MIDFYVLFFCSLEVVLVWVFLFSFHGFDLIFMFLAFLIKMGLFKASLLIVALSYD